MVLIAIGLLLFAVSAASALPTKGQRGYGLSVFDGSKVERFEVEILGSIEGFGSAGATILAKLSGAGLEHTGVMQGMSGSPVYIDDVLIGAVMSTWSYAKDPIAGIRPIEEMRSIGEDAELLGSAELSADSEIGSGIVWAASGFPESLKGRMEEVLASPVMAAAGGSTTGSMAVEGTLEAGEPVAVLLVDGDARLFATGTVTERIGDTVLAFGHPFLGAGQVSFPMARAEVVALLASREISFKIARAGQTVGALKLDRRAGISGVLGERADTLPVSVSVTGGSHAQSDQYEFQVARMQGLTPQLVAWSAQAAVGDRRALSENQALRIRVVVEIENQAPVVSESAIAGGGVLERLGMEVSLPVGLLQGVFGERPRIKSVNVEASVEAMATMSTLARLQVHDPLLVPGEILRARVELVTSGQATEWKELELQLPGHLSPGVYQLHVTDGATAFAQEISRSAPRWARLGTEQVREGLAMRKRADRLVAVLYGPSRSMIIDGVELHSLPSRVGAVLGREYAAPAGELSLATPYAQSEQPLENVTNGSVTLLLRTKYLPLPKTNGHSTPPNGQHAPKPH